MRHRTVWMLAAAWLPGCTAMAPSDPSGPIAPYGVQQSAPSLTWTIAVDGVPNGAMAPGKPAAWETAIADARTGAPVTRFDQHHEKPMHLVVVRDDLSTFAHLHPPLGADGRFRMRLNAPAADADNLDAARAVPAPGTYFLFAEVAPSGQSPVVLRHAVTASGVASPVPLTPDPVGADGFIRKPVGTDGRYEAALKVERGEHHPGMAMLSLVVHLRERGADGQYRDVSSLEPWLGMSGHALMVGERGETASDRVFLHLHAGHGGHGDGHDHGHGAAASPVTFMAHGAEIPPAGRYKLWVQLKHAGDILTIPFALTR